MKNHHLAKPGQGMPKSPQPPFTGFTSQELETARIHWENRLQETMDKLRTAKSFRKKTLKQQLLRISAQLKEEKS